MGHGTTGAGPNTEKALPTLCLDPITEVSGGMQQ